MGEMTTMGKKKKKERKDRDQMDTLWREELTSRLQGRS